jgi:serine/threonine-protein kinase
MSPEQILTPQAVGPASDLFALGSVLYFLATGQHAFDGGSLPKTLKNVQKGSFTPILELRGDLPKAFAEVVERLLVRDPKKRIASAELVAEALQPAIGKNAQETLHAFLVKQSQPLQATQVVPLQQLSADPRHTQILSTSKKTKALIVEDPLVPVVEEVVLRPPRPPAKKSSAASVLVASLIFATSILVVGVLVAELDIMAGLRDWLRSLFR